MLKSLREILIVDKTCIFIPSYQRGYRWTATEVRQLLSDIDGQEGKYFLQLLAVREDQNDSVSKRIRIIDGQQRLTTALLILKHMPPPFPEFTIKYESRGVDGGDLDVRFQNVAIATIKEYLKGRDEYWKRSFKEKLLSCEFLYHDIAKVESCSGDQMLKREMDLFHRLNLWKMPMRDSELVKAVVLSDCSAFNATLRANEWDEIEHQLNDDEFFAFISPSPERDGSDRMGYLMEIALNLQEDEKGREKFPLFTRFEGGADSVDERWQTIRSTFRRLRSWYKDEFLYHLIGWYVHCRANEGRRLMSGGWNCYVNAAFDCAEKIAKTPQRVLVFGECDNIIRDYLFLANVSFCAMAYAPRYKFSEHYKNDPKSIEHIHARNQRELTREEFGSLYQGKIPEDFYDKFHDLWVRDKLAAEEELCRECKSRGVDYKYLDGSIDNCIGNLALLTVPMNSKFNNNTFQGKQELLESSDEWVPPLTKAAFLKRLPGLDQLRRAWTPEIDRPNYQEFLSKLVLDFIAHKQIGAIYGN